MREKELAAATERDRAAIELQREIAEGQVTAEDARRRNEARQRADRDEDPAHKMKVFGDAIRNSLVKMADDPLDAITFFDNVEKLFRTYSVPGNMQVDLIRPYLSARAAAIVARMDDETVENFEATKKLLLYELKLVPSVFRERFNRVEKTDGETYVRFASRLRSLLKHYISERGVETLDDLIQLLVCDRIKGTLPESCLKFVLSTEATKEQGWMQLKELTELVDNYFACHWNSQTGRSFGAAQRQNGPSGGSSPGQPYKWGAGRAAATWGAGTAAAPLSGASLAASKASITFNAPEKERGVKGGCFVCHKVGCHSRNHQSNPKRINRTILDNKNMWQDESPQKFKLSACQLHTDRNDRPTLSYVNVCLRDRPDAEGVSARGLEDSGAEVSLIRESYAAELGLQIESHGTLTVRGIVGDPIKVGAANLFVELEDGGEGGINQILFGYPPS